MEYSDKKQGQISWQLMLIGLGMCYQGRQRNLIFQKYLENNIYWVSILSRALYQRVLEVFKSNRSHSLTLKKFEWEDENTTVKLSRNIEPK